MKEKSVVQITYLIFVGFIITVFSIDTEHSCYQNATAKSIFMWTFFYSVIGVYIESVKSVQIIFNFHIFLFVLDHTRWNETFKRQNESTHFWDMISMLSFYVTSELSWQLVWRMNPIEMLQSSLSCKINFIVLECFFIIFFWIL